MSRLIVRSLRAGLAWGLTAGLIVCAAATAIDWSANPGGIFHDDAGTAWGVVLETAWSWFWPVALAVGAVAGSGRAWAERRARREPPDR